MGVTELQINGFADFNGIKDMASKTRYTEEFKKKVVEEYKIGDLSLEEVATKHGLPPVLLQDWVNKDDVNNIFIRYVERPKEKTSIFTKVKTACVIAFQNLKTYGWLLAGCLPLLICLTTFIKCNKMVVESEMNENLNPAEVKMDSLLTINNELKSEIGKLGVTLEKIDNELKMNITPKITINNVNRRFSHRTRNTTNKNQKVVKTEEKKEIINDESKATMPIDTCCCRCPKDTIK